MNKLILIQARKLSISEKKCPLGLLAKLMEECGELAQEVTIAENSPGSAYKSEGKDGVKGEVADAILVLLSIFLQARRHARRTRKSFGLKNGQVGRAPINKTK